MGETKKMKVVRTLAGIRQIDVSIRTGIPCSILSLIENDLRKPTDKQARAINKVLGECVFEIIDKNTGRNGRCNG